MSVNFNSIRWYKCSFISLVKSNFIFLVENKPNKLVNHQKIPAYI